MQIHAAQKTVSAGAASTKIEETEAAEVDPSLPLTGQAERNSSMWQSHQFFASSCKYSPYSSRIANAFGSSVYTPAIPYVMYDFQISDTIATVPLTTYALGLSFGPMLSAPISETVGRLGTYRYAVPISALFTLGAGFAPNIAALCVLRLFAGLFGGAPLSVCAGTSADLFRPKERAVAGTLLLYTGFLGPAVGPIVGGFVTQHNGWKWSQYALAIIMIVSYIPVLFLEETYLKIILRRNAKAESAANPHAKPAAKALLLGILLITLLRPLKMLLTEPIVAFLALYVAFNFAVLFIFFGSIPLRFESVYHFNRGESGLVFLAIGLGCKLAILTLVILDKLFYQEEYQKRSMDGQLGIVAPEHRLWAAMIGSFGMPIGLFWFAWSARSDVHWIIPALAIVPYGWGNLCTYVSACLYLVDTYAALTAASAIAANGLLRYIFGGTFPLFTITRATSLLGFVALAMLPIPWILYKWGPNIRAHSNFETNKIPE
ncbi:Polyamine transporter 4 [Hyphodiscus hymeniophilus]|uniref:Polyamine transporter 4 n=1 Tax=Hyphodiscus hymeniophilus TaxID=353542 RepID=A0A9P6VIN6_9HELO|nr:Polyamine transporter 4 [Hyphodiscus hymeniophilus]